MALESEITRQTFRKTYRGKLEEGVVLIGHSQKSEITPDQLQNVLLAHMVGFSGKKPLPECFLADEHSQDLFYRKIQVYDDLIADESKDFSAGEVMRIHPYNFRGVPF